MHKLLHVTIVLLTIISCKTRNDEPVVQGISDLKRGEIISCSPQPGEIFGTVNFEATVPAHLKEDFNMAVALLHSFEYDEAEKMFARIIDASPGTAMAYWGVAMSNFHPLWAPPGEVELKKGKMAIDIATSIREKTKREEDYVEALAGFYKDAHVLDHKTRVREFEKRMAAVYGSYENDPEAAVFYALALNASADPMDKTYSNQKKAVAILQDQLEKQPMHPGIVHYIIHNCDYPELAMIALPAARKYASIAPSSAHAQHMPSHIFTRLGLWDECISSNLVSAYSAKCYAEKAKLKGHWDEELHAMDYLVYSYLQKGRDDSARVQVEYLRTIKEVSPLNFKTSYAFAAIPARYLLERKQWRDAADYQIHPEQYPWEKYSWQKAIYHFTRLMGSVHTKDLEKAHLELAELKNLHERLVKERDKNKESMQVDIQVKTGEAWIAWKMGKQDDALQLMIKAADMEDAMEKHPVTPGEVIPARELLGEMLLEMNRPGLALMAFEQDLLRHANRLNGLYGAAVASMEAGDNEKARTYFTKILQSADEKSKRQEIQKARMYLKQMIAAR